MRADWRGDPCADRGRTPNHGVLPLQGHLCCPLHLGSAVGVLRYVRSPQSVNGWPSPASLIGASSILTAVERSWAFSGRLVLLAYRGHWRLRKVSVASRANSVGSTPPRSGGPVQPVKHPYPTLFLAKPEPPFDLSPTSYEYAPPTRIRGVLPQSSCQSLAGQDRGAVRPLQDQSTPFVSRHSRVFLAPSRGMPSTNDQARGSLVPIQQVRVLTDLRLYSRTLCFDQLSRSAAIGDTQHRRASKTQTEVAPQVAPSENRPGGCTEFPNWAIGNNPYQRRSDWPTRSAPHSQNDSTSHAETGEVGMRRRVRQPTLGILGPRPLKLFPFSASAKRNLA